MHGIHKLNILYIHHVVCVGGRAIQNCNFYIAPCRNDKHISFTNKLLIKLLSLIYRSHLQYILCMIQHYCSGLYNVRVKLQYQPCFDDMWLIESNPPVQRWWKLVMIRVDAIGLIRWWVSNSNNIEHEKKTVKMI